MEELEENIEVIEEKVSYFVSNEFLFSVITLVIAVVIILVIGQVFKHLQKKTKDSERIGKKSRTYVRLFKNLLEYLIFFIAVVIILKINGIDTGSLLAGLGIASVIAGLALQDALRDIITGVNILADGYYCVGDTLNINGTQAKVLQLGLKCTKLKDIINGDTIVIANRNIDRAIVISKQLDIDIPLPYEETLKTIEPVIEEIVNKIKELENCLGIEYKGINQFGDSSILYKIRMQAEPENKPQLKRDANRIIKEILDKHKISIPYTQIDIHNK